LREQRAAYRIGLPGPLYCDSSALLKLYWPEPGSTEFNDTVEGRDDLLVSDLAVTEIVSALCHRHRQGAVTDQTIRRVQEAIIKRLDDGTFGRIELTRDTHRRAEEFFITLSGIALRAADALHLAMATSARAASMASFDARQRAAARAMGLTLYPPEQTS
jgi:uncharacterized protein